MKKQYCAIQLGKTTRSPLVNQAKIVYHFPSAPREAMTTPADSTWNMTKQKHKYKPADTWVRSLAAVLIGYSLTRVLKIDRC